MTPPKPAGTMRTAMVAPVATMRHFTNDDTASATSESTAIHSQEPRKMPVPTNQLAENQGVFDSCDWRKNMISSGNQVTAESTPASTSTLPAIYSARDNGRLRNRGSAL